jgi:acetyl-CoA carboxylase biotin carboxyl carrier protein
VVPAHGASDIDESCENLVLRMIGAINPTPALNPHRDAPIPHPPPRLPYARSLERSNVSLDRDPQDPPLDAASVTDLLRAIADAGWDEASLLVEGTTLVYSRSSATPSLAAAVPAPAEAPADSSAGSAPAARPSAADPPPAVEDPVIGGPSTSDAVEGHTVSAPSLGLFWRSPQPGAPPFVEIGDEIEEGATVCIVEVMKLMNHVKADVAGRVIAIHQDNGEMVEYGSPLVTLEPS